MMSRIHAALIAACAAALSGCAAAQVNETTFAAQREALIGSAALRDKTVSDCVSTISKNPALVEKLAVTADTTKEKAPALVCGRFVKAQIDGKYTYEQYVQAKKGLLTPENVRIAQGR